MQAVKSHRQYYLQDQVPCVVVPRAAVEALMSSLESQTFQPPQGAAPDFDADVFLNEFKYACKIDYRMRPKTIKSHMRHAKRLLEFLKKHPLRTTRQELRVFLTVDPAQYAVKTLRVMYKRFLDSDLASSFKIPRSTPRPVIVPTQEQLKKTYANLKTLEVRAAFMLFATSGLRRHELLELTPAQIDFEKRMILPGRDLGGETTKFQWITFFNYEAKEVLIELLAEKSPLPNERIFTMVEDNYTKRIKSASRITGFKITAQVLRKWFCCEMGRLRVPDRYVDAFCGRVPKKVIGKHYTDYSPERLKEIYDGAGLRVLDVEGTISDREGFRRGGEEKVRNSDPTVLAPPGSPMRGQNND